jgi:serine/threonine protein kinase
MEAGSVGSAFFFVMEYCNRGSLYQLMKRHRGKLPLDTAAPLILQCLAGLEHAHEHKFVHRDLKPHNILLNERGGRWIAKVSDFGLAKDFEKAGLSGMTATGGFGGTCYFMPREQLVEFKRIRPVSDVWSIAATFYNALTGRYPLEFSSNRDPVEVILHDEPIPVRRRDSNIPVKVATVLDRALSTDTSRRFQTAAELRTAFVQAMGTQT